MAHPLGTVIHHAALVLPVVDSQHRPAPPIPGGAVAVRDGVITAVGTLGDVRLAVEGGAPEREWPGALMPGLVNAHTHLQYSGYGELATTGLPFPDWLAAMMRRRTVTTDEMWAQGAAAGAAALLRSGTTAVADVVTDTPAVAPVMASGLGGISYLETLGWDDAAWLHTGREGYRSRLAADLGAGHRVGVMPHAPYTLDVDVIADIVAMGRAAGLRTHTHLAESGAETEFVARGTGRFAAAARAAGWDLALVADGGCGMTPVHLLDTAGCLDDRLHVAHGVHADADDRRLLRERGVTVALCPRSNAILQAGEPPVAAYLREGSPIALGTDSLASSPSLDLLDEARAAFALAREQGYSHADLATRLLHAATFGGARAMGLHLSTEAAAPRGGLYPGARADLAVLAAAGTTPDDLLRTGRCVATVVAGAVVVDTTG